MSDQPDGHIELKAGRENYERFMAFIESRLHHARVSPRDRAKILTACEEVTVNIINYAYTDGEGDLRVAFDATPDFIRITFVDAGTPFNPLERPDAAARRSLEELQPGGFGIFMVKRLMDNVQYEYRGNKNILQITKNISDNRP